MKRSKALLYSFIVFFAAFLIYSITISYDLTDLDDQNMIIHYSSAYDAPQAVIKAFKTNVLFGGQTPYYRPVLSLSFVISHKIAGQSIAFAHFINVFLHALCTLLLFLFLRRYLFKENIAFLAALVFAVHPIAIYTAAWIPGRNDSLFLLSFIFAFAFFIEYLDKKKLLFLLGHIFFTLACFFTKESAVILPAVFALYYITNKKPSAADVKQLVLSILLWIAALVLFLNMRKAVFPDGALSLSLLSFHPDNIRMFFDYYSAVLFGRTPFGALFGEVSPWLYIFGAIAMALTVFFAFYKNSFEQKKRMFFWLIIPLFFLAPNLIGERLWFQGNRMYAPLMAFIVLFFSFFTPALENQKYRKIALALIWIIILLCAGKTLYAQAGFKDNVAFWDKVIKESNFQNLTAHKFHSFALISKGRFQEAVNESYNTARAAGFANAEIMYGLAYALYMYKDYANAAKTFERIRQIAPNWETAKIYAGIIASYYSLNDKKQGDKNLKEFAALFNASVQEAFNFVANFDQYMQQQRNNALLHLK